MYFANNHDEVDLKKNRRPKTLRLRTLRRKKTVSTGFGGNHRRRNKHWSW